ncbi:MAG: FAD/NAD(P)-binding protein [Rhizobiales bacterium]|nr:FAD/NAD(P)-binding protein [Hyphomicrobiales bacterium]
MSDNAFDVAVIGTGLSDSLLAIQLLRQLPAGCSVALVGKAGETGAGLAYGTRDRVHLLNVRAARMSLDPDDEGDFVAWLAARHPELEAAAGMKETYAPRAIYGDYVRERLAGAMREAGGRIHTSLFTSEVMGMERDGEEYVLELATGDAIRARHVGLCLGNPPGRLPLPGDSVDAAARPRIVDDPWHDRRMAQIAPEARILFVGTGLTMVDQVMSRRIAGRRGAMIAISRHGLLPATHGEVSSPPAAWQPPANNGRLRRTMAGSAFSSTRSLPPPVPRRRPAATGGAS